MMDDYGPVSPGEKRKLCARIDLKDADVVDEVNLDDTITVVIKGKVKTLKGVEKGKRPTYREKGPKEEAYEYPGKLEMEISSVKVSTDGKFDGMMKDYD